MRAELPGGVMLARLARGVDILRFAQQQREVDEGQRRRAKWKRPTGRSFPKRERD